MNKNAGDMIMPQVESGSADDAELAVETPVEVELTVVELEQESQILINVYRRDR